MRNGTDGTDPSDRSHRRPGPPPRQVPPELHCLPAPKARALLALALGTVLFAASPTSAVVFYARDEALQMAFPGAQVEARDYFLTAEQRRAVEERSRAPIESDLVTLYHAKRDGEVVAYGYIDTHQVRTLPETLLVVLSPGGHVTATHLLAFYEPAEYSAPPRWLEQFRNKGADDDLQVGRQIAALTGSTLTSRAVAASVRRALALHAVLIEGK